MAGQQRAWVVTVAWPESGQDLDLYVTLSAGGQTTSGIGWNNGSQTPVLEINSGGINGTFYAKWGGDNTNRGGSETITIYFSGTLPAGDTQVATVTPHCNYYHKLGSGDDAQDSTGAAEIDVDNQSGTWYVSSPSRHYGTRATESDPSVNVPLYADGGSPTPFPTLVTVTLDPNRADATVTPDKIYYLSPTSSTIYGTLPNAISPSAVFDGWYTSAGAPVKSSSFLAALTDHTLYAHWKYTITAEVRDITAGGIFIATPGVASINGGSAAKSVSENFSSGSLVTLRAYPTTTDYVFDHWELSGTNVSTSETLTITVSGAAKYVAVFVSATPDLAYVSARVAQNQTNVGDVRINGGQWLDVTSATFNSPQTVTVEARATDPLYVFKNWTDDRTGNVVATSSSYSFTVAVNPPTKHWLTANFQYAGVRVNLQVENGEGGTVRFGSANVVARDMYVGETDTIIATPSEGWEFVKWKKGSADYSTDATTSISISSTPSEVNYTAIFTRVAYKLTLFANPQNLGYVAYAFPDPDNPGQYIVSNWDRSHSVLIPVAIAESGDVEIYADPTATFVNWQVQRNPPYGSYADLSTAPYIAITILNDAFVRANFQSAPTYTVTATVSPVGSGTVSGISNPYKLSDPCSISATPAEGFRFVKWEDISGTFLSNDVNYEFNVTANTAVVAIFEQIPTTCDISVKVYNARGGTVTDGVNSGTSFVATVEQNQEYTLQATPAAGFRLRIFRRTLGGSVYTSTENSLAFTAAEQTVVVVFCNDLLVNSSTAETPARLVYDPTTNLLVADY